LRNGNHQVYHSEEKANYVESRLSYDLARCHPDAVNHGIDVISKTLYEAATSGMAAMAGGLARGSSKIPAGGAF
jgi:hypothetical protein